MPTMHQLTAKDGDLRLTWTAGEPDEAEARRVFSDLRQRGYLAYKVEGDERTQIRRFDPQSQQIVLVRPSQGG